MPDNLNWENINNNEVFVDGVRILLNECYSKERRIDNKQIETINKELLKIPNLVINFDETMTEKSTISTVIDELSQLLPEQKHELETKFKNWANDNYNYDKNKSKVKRFYEDVIAGIDKDVLESVYENTADKMTPNPNLEKVFQYIRENKKCARIPLFVLSLNNYQFIEIFYNRYEHEFKKYGVIIAGVMGNQIEYDEQDKVKSVIEHVTNGNKHEFIPEHTIMLADSRETKDLLKRNVNVLNIQSEQFNLDLLNSSFVIVDVIRILRSYRGNRNFPKKEIIAQEIYNLVFRMKNDWEENANTDEKKVLKINKLEENNKTLLKLIVKFRKI